MKTCESIPNICFSDNTAIFGNDLATLPDFPAEIRAPKGSLPGVSSFQLQFSNKNVHTPGDELDVLVAMNPAGFKVHLGDLKENGLLIVNTANFTKRNLSAWFIWSIKHFSSGWFIDYFHSSSFI